MSDTFGAAIIFILFMAGVIISLYNSYKYTKLQKKLFLIGNIMWISQIILIISMIIFCKFAWDKTSTKIHSHDFEITAISDNLAIYITPRVWSVEGDTEVRYYFMRPSDGGFKQGYVPADRSIIYEANDTKPHIECYYIGIDSEEHPYLATWFATDWDSIDENDKEYHIYIPKGSIITSEYNIDLE